MTCKNCDFKNVTSPTVLESTCDICKNYSEWKEETNEK